MAREVDALLGLVFAEQRKSGRLDLEAIEMAMRAAMHRAGAGGLEQLLEMSPPVERAVACGCGQQARFHEMRPKHIVTALGRIRIRRAYYLCSHCQQGQSPADLEWDIEGTECSPAVRRMMALVGSEGSFEQGRLHLKELAGLEITCKAVERQAEAIGADIARRNQQDIQRAIQLDLPEMAAPGAAIMYVEMDGTGIPVVAAETEGRAGKTDGEPGRTREVKLGCVFTQTGTDDEGRPVRDEDSTTYTGAIETCDEFGRRLYSEAWYRGWSHARRKVVLGDGALWIWNIADEHFPGAVQIVDLYHAREHLWELSGKLFPIDSFQRKRWVSRLQGKLDNGKIEKLVAALRRFPSPTDEQKRWLETEANYFERNVERMRYPQFREQNFFVGSGVIEAGCRTVIGLRLKRSGMFWTVRGANAIIALRCNRLSHRFEDYWESRRAA